MTLFDDSGLRVEPAEPGPPPTHGEALRARQTARIRAGLHPLSMGTAVIRLHPDAPRDAEPGDGRDYPRCATCRFRQQMGGHARSFPKCLVDYQERDLTDEEIARNAGTLSRHATKWIDYGPRVTASDASDVRAYWPACDRYEAAE